MASCVSPRRRYALRQSPAGRIRPQTRKHSQNRASEPPAHASHSPLTRHQPSTRPRSTGHATETSYVAVLKVRDSGRKPVSLDPKQAYNDGHLHNGAGRRLMARTVPPAVCDGCGALGCSVVMLTPRTCWGPTRAGTSIPRHHEANSTTKRPIHLPAYDAHAA